MAALRRPANPGAKVVSGMGILRLVLPTVKNFGWGLVAVFLLALGCGVLVAVATPRTLDDQGRMVGDYLLALDDAGAYLW